MDLNRQYWEDRYSAHDGRGGGVGTYGETLSDATAEVIEEVFM